MNTSNSTSIFGLLVKGFTRLVERYYPDPFVFAILATLLTMALVLGVTDTSANGTLDAWGNGLPRLLTFTAQLSITLLAAHALAHTDVVQKLLTTIGSAPASAPAAYALVALVSGISSLIAWSLGLVVGATLAVHVARQCSLRQIKVHYPLLIASAYSGFVVWHMGYSSSAALFVATPGHSLEPIMGILPITETVFTWQNGLLIIISLVAIAVICPLMRPSDEDVIEVKPERFETSTLEQPKRSEAFTFADILEQMRFLSFLLGLLLLLFISWRFATTGFNLTLDLVNWSFVGLGLILARSPSHYVHLITNASGSVGPILLLYPFYAGILGLMTDTGLGSMISEWFVQNSNSDTLGFSAFLSAGLINMFIPSGGGQWALQGPIFIEAANQLNVDYSVIVLAVAYGDQWTNMVQPFWTIPLLAIAGLHLRQIMGYTLIIFIATGIIFGSGLLLLGANLS